MPLAPGAQVGPYEVVAPIGAGGMGEVYRARDPRLGRDVAIKVLPASVTNDADRLRRFELEAKATSALNHPNILAVFDVGSHDGAPYVVSELLEGDTLRARVDGGALPLRKALDYATQIARGLAAAHEKGIVHRDLKPENLFVTRDGRVKILDFGLAKLVGPEASSQESEAPTATQDTDTGTSPGKILGTAGYMSPEQVKGLPATHRSDIFSFGSILYEMLSGRRAFRGATSVETMAAILREDPPELSGTSGAPLPPGLERILRHCLEKSPDERFQSARDLAFNLEALSSVSAVGIPAPRLPGMAGRNMRRAILVTLALLLAATLGALTAFLLRQLELPTFTRLTFRRGYVSSARFAPDGQTVVFGATWEDEPLTLFSTRPGSLESRALGLPQADVLSISSAGEMALALAPGGAHAIRLSGTLARASLAGGAPRELLEDAPAADWASNGELAVVHWSEGRCRIEHPIGKVLYTSDSILRGPRVSPRGDLVAFVESSLGDVRSSVVATVDSAGRRTALTEPVSDVNGPAWSPSGSEVWYTTLDGKGQTILRAVTAAGRRRMVARVPGIGVLQDVFRDGRVLLSLNSVRVSVIGRAPGDQHERNLSWHDASDLVDLSYDGRTLVLSETGFAGGSEASTYLRGTDGSPAVRLGDGLGMALSPDGKWVLARTRGPRLTLLPTRAGESRALESSGLTELSGASWFADSRRFAFAARTSGGSMRVFFQDTAGGERRALTPDGMDVRFPLVSEAARLIAASGPEGEVVTFPIQGGEPRPVAGTLDGDIPIQWSPDGRLLYVFRPFDLPVTVFAVDLAAGSRRLWRGIAIADTAGVHDAATVAITPDGKFIAHSFTRALSDLYLVEGLR